MRESVRMRSASDVDDFIQNCKRNLQVLQKNLSELGYRFLRSTGPYEFADEADRLTIALTEKRLGKLPLLLRRWYETFRYVDFSQDQGQLQGGSSRASGLGYNVTLVFRELDWCIQFRDVLRSSGTVVDRGQEDRRLLPFGTFASNCEPKGVWLPDDAIDPAIYDEGAGPVSFSDEVRTAFRCGGFPFWERMFRKRRFVSPLGFSPKFLELRESLRQNIVDV